MKNPKRQNFFHSLPRSHRAFFFLQREISLGDTSKGIGWVYTGMTDYYYYYFWQKCDKKSSKILLSFQQVFNCPIWFSNKKIIKNLVWRGHMLEFSTINVFIWSVSLWKTRLEKSLTPRFGTLKVGNFLLLKKSGTIWSGLYQRSGDYMKRADWLWNCVVSEFQVLDSKFKRWIL